MRGISYVCKGCLATFETVAAVRCHRTKCLLPPVATEASPRPKRAPRTPPEAPLSLPAPATEAASGTEVVTDADAETCVTEVETVRDVPDTEASSANATRAGNELDQVFGETDVPNIPSFLRSEYRRLIGKRQLTPTLKKLKRLRRCLFRTGDMELYAQTLLENEKSLKRLFEDNNVLPKRQSKLFRQHFTLLDLRLIGRTGHSSQPAAVDGGLWHELSLVLKGRAGNDAFDISELCGRTCNVDMGVFPLEELVSRELTCEPDKVRYFGDLESEDRFSFYCLESKIGPVRHWRMDCRLEETSRALGRAVTQYASTLFRLYYRNAFGDNRCREDFTSGLGALEGECTTLLRAIVAAGDAKGFADMCRAAVIRRSSRCGVEPGPNDRIKLRKADPIVSPHEGSSLLSLLMDLFEGDEEERQILAEKIERKGSH